MLTYPKACLLFQRKEKQLKRQFLIKLGHEENAGIYKINKEKKITVT